MMNVTTTRLRRLRQKNSLRKLVQENNITVNDLVMPIFVKDKLTTKVEIASMPGCFQLGLNELDDEVDEIVSLGVFAVILFGIPSEKDALGSASMGDNGIVQQAIRRIKKRAPDLLVISDVCFCEYTDHGHCGVVVKSDDGMCGDTVDNDTTLPLLAQQAVSHAKAGADIVAPSGMLDNMVAAIRLGLDEAGYTKTLILSYAVKYASSFYGPFREAAEGAPKSGDRKSYQMNPANAAIGLLEAKQDIEQGADMVMVKPGMPYLDMVQRIKQNFPGTPLAVYQVSGEYSMIKAAALQGFLDERETVLESVVCMKRSGADIIITYFAKQIAKYLTAR